MLKSKLKAETKDIETISQREEKKLNKRLNELDNLFKKLYEDRVLENITERNYTLMAENYQKEQNEILEKLNKIELKQREEKAIDTKVIDFADTIKEYKGIEELTRTIVIKLIEKITISEKYDDENGQKIKML